MRLRLAPRRPRNAEDPMSSRILQITALAALLLGGLAWLAARTGVDGAPPELRWTAEDEIPLGDDEVPLSYSLLPTAFCWNSMTRGCLSCEKRWHIREACTHGLHTIR